MTNPAFDVDQVLKSLASQSIKQGRDVRAAVRIVTLKALQQRELTLDQIGKVLRSVTEGVTLGVAKRETKVEKALADTVAGMDDALLKAVQASNVALHRLTGEGYDYEDSNLKRALDELERLEDQFLQSIAQATDSAEIAHPNTHFLCRTTGLTPNQAWDNALQQNRSCPLPPPRPSRARRTGTASSPTSPRIPAAHARGGGHAAPTGPRPRGADRLRRPSIAAVIAASKGHRRRPRASDSPRKGQPALARAAREHARQVRAGVAGAARCPGSG